MASRIFRMASGILRIGDVVSLVGKAVAEVSDADVSGLTKNMSFATFDFDVFLNKSELITKMGSFAVSQICFPVLVVKLMQITQVKKRHKKNKAIIGSMTKKEIANPDLFVKDRSSQSRTLERFMKRAFNSLVNFKR